MDSVNRFGKREEEPDEIPDLLFVGGEWVFGFHWSAQAFQAVLVSAGDLENAFLFFVGSSDAVSPIIWR